MTAPLMVELFCGLGGASEGAIGEGYRCVGFDIERHDYGTGGYPGELVIQNVLTIHGRQLKDAAYIWASPPCQEYSFMAMPWSRAKQIAKALRGNGEFPEGYTGSRTIAELTALFDACFRIQREAIAATWRDCPACFGLGPRHSTEPCARCKGAGGFTRHIPMVVENVKGAQPWVGKAKANYGSFYLWGDVESVGGRIVAAHQVKFGAPAVKAFKGRKPDGLPELNGHDDPRRRRATKNGSWFGIGADGKSNLIERGKSDAFSRINERDEQAGDSDRVLGGIHFEEGARAPGGILSGLEDGLKVPGLNFHEHERTGKPGRSFQSAAVDQLAGVKNRDADGYERNHPDAFGWKAPRSSSSSSARRAASAAIAKIPEDLARHIARCFRPQAQEKIA
jgi:hypothetical protein